MKAFQRFLVALLLSLTFWAPLLHADDDFEVGDLVKVKILDVRPTQFSVGAKEIQFRSVKIEGKDEDGTLADYKKENAGKVVIGPDGSFFLVDGHHFARALFEMGKESMRVEILKDYSDLSWNAFWAKLRQKHLCYLRDSRGRLRSPSELPKTIAGLKDDPYRSLSWLVRRAEGYEDLDAPFQEFFWAQYFRRRIKKWEDTSGAWEKALMLGMRLAKARKASHLAGWTGEQGDCAEVLEMLHSED